MQRYRLIFDGHIQAQASPEEVRRRLADLFQVETDQIESLFARPPVVLKEGLVYEEALRDKADFEATGALCRLAPEDRAARRSDPSPGPSAARQDATAGRERRYRLYHPYLLAFFSRAFYADVAAHWRARAFVHLLLVLLLTATVYMLRFQSLIDTFISEKAPAIVAQVPEIRILNGVVQVDVEEPYTIREPDGGSVFAVIDTTGKITSLSQTEAVLLLTASRLAVRLNAGDARIIDLRTIASLKINQATVSQWLQDIQKWSPFVLFPLALGFSFLFRSVQALLYGGLGMAIATLQQIPLPFGAAVSIAIMAMTPLLLVDALLMLLNIDWPLWRWGGFLLAIGYLVFGIRSARRHDPS
jgi:hypothetical protein